MKARIELFSATEVTYSYLLTFYKHAAGHSNSNGSCGEREGRKPLAHKADVLRNEAHARTTILHQLAHIKSDSVYADCGKSLSAEIE